MGSIMAESVENDILHTLSTTIFARQNIFIATFVALSVSSCYSYFKNNYNFWSRLGIKGETPLPLVNDIYNILLKDRAKNDKERLRKYGKVYGIFLQGIPRLVVADPEILRQICIKDFDAFQNHNLPPWANKYQRLFLVWLQGDHWKHVRSMMSPSFTSGKIKRMFRFLDACADDLVAAINEQLDKAGEKQVEVNTKDTFGMFTMDGISTCCYGLKLDRESDASNVKSLATRNDFVQAALKILRISMPRMFIIFVMPKWLRRLLRLEVSPESNFQPMAQRIGQLIEKRRQSPKKYDDLLQLLIDTRLGDEMELDEMDQEENHHVNIADNKALLDDQASMMAPSDPRGLMDKELSVKNELDRSNGNPIEQTGGHSKKVQLSDLEILSEAILMLVAGFETTSTLLTTCTYALAFHQEVQQKLYEEIKAISKPREGTNGSKFEYESLTSCKYLDAVISESLRYLAPVPFSDRIASRDYSIEKYNIKIPKGFSVLLNINSVQTNPDYWEEPDKFKPERFLPGEREKIVPGSYMPFSMGPRHCIGMRFSLTEAKIGLAKTLLNYKLSPASNTLFPPNLSRAGGGLISLKRPLIKIEKRA